MDWCHLEGIERVMVSYRVWRQCCRDLRYLRKVKYDPLHKRILKEDVQIEFDELVDAILSLTHKEYAQLLQTVKSDRLYHLLYLYQGI
jgi:hypothetical protein